MGSVEEEDVIIYPLKNKVLATCQLQVVDPNGLSYQLSLVKQNTQRYSLHLIMRVKKCI